MPACRVPPSDSWALMQITAAPSAGRISSVPPSLTPFGNMGVYASAHLSPAATGIDKSALRCAASAESMGHISSQVPDQPPTTRLPLSQAPSWRQLISQPLYPERLPAADSSQVSSSTPDLVHAAAREHHIAPASSGLSCPHCSVRLGSELTSNTDTADPKIKAWSADLYKGLSGIIDSRAALPKSHLSSRGTVAPWAGTSTSRVHAQANDAPHGSKQHAEHAGSASHRSNKLSQQTPVQRSAQQRLGKENAKQQAEKQAQPRQVPDRLQRRSSQRRAESPASTTKDDLSRYGSPRSVHTSGSLTSRLGLRGGMPLPQTQHCIVTGRSRQAQR